jgi:beta-galactosidase
MAEILVPMTGTLALATYRGRYYSERAAITLHHFGKGACLYLGTVLDAAGLAEVLLPVLVERGLEGRALPTGVEVAARTSASGTRFRFYVNHSAKQVQVEPLAPGLDLLTRKAVTGAFAMDPLGVAVIREG